MAELVGILLGDGSFYVAKNNHETDIALDTKEMNYKNYVKDLLKTNTGAYVWEKRVRHVNCVHLRISSKKHTMALLRISLGKPGNKIKNKVTIPRWIWNNNSFLKSCVRGLMDTDGSISRLEPQWPNLFQLSFKNNNKRLLDDVRKAFIKLNFHPSRIFGNRLVITRQKEIERYFETVGSKNDTHLKKYDLFLKINGKCSPVV